MSDCIIDCCSLLNLYTGWKGLKELRLLKYTWHICEAAARESQFTREYTPDGAPVEVALDLPPLIESKLLRVARPESETEIADYVEFATEIDDGEAQALAIAKHRKYILLTDDRKAGKIAGRAGVEVTTLTTADVLREWQRHSAESRDVFRGIVERIAVLARFSPPKNSADFSWWQAQRDK